MYLLWMAAAMVCLLSTTSFSYTLPHPAVDTSRLHVRETVLGWPVLRARTNGQKRGREGDSGGGGSSPNPSPKRQNTGSPPPSPPRSPSVRPGRSGSPFSSSSSGSSVNHLTPNSQSPSQDHPFKMSRSRSSESEGIASARVTADGPNSRITTTTSQMDLHIPDHSKLSLKKWANEEQGRVEIRKQRPGDRPAGARRGTLSLKGHVVSAKLDASDPTSRGGYLMAVGGDGTRYKKVGPGQVKKIKARVRRLPNGAVDPDQGYGEDGFARAKGVLRGIGKLTGGTKFVPMRPDSQGGSPVISGEISDRTPSTSF